MDGEYAVEVPTYFICPISMQPMRDPVTLCTGITYERQSIEKWLYEYRKNTCPATRKPLQNRDLTPNHTLRRLIQGWRSANTCPAIHPNPAPNPPIEPSQVHELLQRALHSPLFHVVSALAELRRLVGESEANRRCIAAAGATDVLISVIETFSAEIECQGGCCSFDCGRACEEALTILYDMLVTYATVTDDIEKLACNWKCVSSMAWILKRGRSQARFHAAMLFHNIATNRIANRNSVIKAISSDDLLEGLLELLTEEVCHKATVCSLEILMAICSSRKRNRLKAIEAGAIHVLIHTLLETQRRSCCERMLGLLEVLCGCAEGRAALIDHAMGIAAVSNCILKVSDVATEKAVRILCLLCKFNPNPPVFQEIMQIGGVSKLLMVLQLQCTSEAKRKAKQLLTHNERFWRKPTCVPLHLLTVYPSNH